MNTPLITVAQPCGLCAGSARSLALAEAALAAGKRVVLFKPLLHNHDVIAFLEAKGAVTAQDLDHIRPGDTVVIRAHGETKAVIDHFLSQGIAYVDGTCPNVQHIHQLIAEAAAAGSRIIIIGDPRHPEVIGSNGWCGNQASIVASEADVARLPACSPGDTVLVVAQTTFTESLFTRLAEQVRRTYPDTALTIRQTICPAARIIQEQAEILARQCGTMIVIGDASSANTTELKRRCAAVCADTRLVEGRAAFDRDLRGGRFDFSRPIGITGGASTMGAVITEAKAILEQRIQAHREPEALP